jgi:hypothetical protein
MASPVAEPTEAEKLRFWNAADPGTREALEKRVERQAHELVDVPARAAERKGATAMIRSGPCGPRKPCRPPLAPSRKSKGTSDGIYDRRDARDSTVRRHSSRP